MEWTQDVEPSRRAAIRDPNLWKCMLYLLFHIPGDRLDHAVVEQEGCCVWGLVLHLKLPREGVRVSIVGSRAAEQGEIKAVKNKADLTCLVFKLFAPWKYSRF